MIQKKFLCKDFVSVEQAVSQIADILSKTPHKSAVVTFYEKGFSKQDVESLIMQLKGCGFPELQIAGLSITLIVELMPEGTGILLNLILTEEADIEVVCVPCLPGAEEDAAQVLRSRIDAVENVKAIELFCSSMVFNTTSFIEKTMEGLKDVVLFGTSTIRNLTKKLSVLEDENTVEVEQISEDMEGDEFAAADRIVYYGYVAVIFSGERRTIAPPGS